MELRPRTRRHVEYTGEPLRNRSKGPMLDGTGPLFYGSATSEKIDKLIKEAGTDLPLASAAAQCPAIYPLIFFWLSFPAHLGGEILDLFSADGVKRLTTPSPQRKCFLERLGLIRSMKSTG